MLKMTFNMRYLSMICYSLIEKKKRVQQQQQQQVYSVLPFLYMVLPIEIQ